MDWRQWARQWEQLERAEGELTGGLAAALATSEAAAVACRPPRSSPLPIEAQLARHLAVIAALQASSSQGVVPPATRRRQACEASAGTLRAAIAAALDDLAPQEQEAAADYDAATQQVQQVLQTPAGAAEALPPEVAACDAFLQRHGATGGWHPDDHAEFERILRACRGNYAHCTQLAAAELALLHTAEAVAQHARWHEELQRLLLAKRLAVQQWRLQRQADRVAALERQQDEAATAAAAAGDSAAQAQATAREERRLAVLEWRAAREQAAAAAVAQCEAAEADQRRREAAALRYRQQENRQQLEQARLHKQEAGAEQRRPSADGSGAAACKTLDPAAQQRLRERNAQLLQRRAQQAAKRGEEAVAAAGRAAALQRRASQQFVDAAERDPGRLLQATAAAAMRQLEVQSAERQPRDSGYVRHISSRRAAPSWCAGARLG